MTQLACPGISCYRVLETPTGAFLLTQDGEGEIRTGWCELDACPPKDARRTPHLLESLAQRIVRFFEGHAVDFSDVPHPDGPPFFRACWRSARDISHGKTWTYAQLASAAGRPGAARAAGQAMRHNPLPVIVPCHRVLATNGGLGGFAGATLPSSPAIRTKSFLLRLEGHASGLKTCPK